MPPPVGPRQAVHRQSGPTPGRTTRDHPLGDAPLKETPHRPQPTTRRDDRAERILVFNQRGASQSCNSLPPGLSSGGSGIRGRYRVECMHPTEATTTAGEPIEGGSKRTLKAPLNGDAVLYLEVEIRGRN